MALSEAHLTQVLEFIRLHRGNEINFRTLHEKLEAELKNGQANPDYIAALTETREKQAAAYAEVREQGGSAWAEFENFVTHFERSITSALKKENSAG